MFHIRQIHIRYFAFAAGDYGLRQLRLRTYRRTHARLLAIYLGQLALIAFWPAPVDKPLDGVALAWLVGRHWSPRRQKDASENDMFSSTGDNCD